MSSKPTRGRFSYTVLLAVIRLVLQPAPGYSLTWHFSCLMSTVWGALAERSTPMKKVKKLLKKAPKKKVTPRVRKAPVLPTGV